jgi:hypothetical protein
MKKLGLIILLSTFLFSFSYAQDYNTGIGIRAGYANGLTIKHFVNSNSALEGIIASRWKGFQITGLYEIHNRAFNTERLNWYYGFGGHIGFWDGDNTNKYWGDPGESYTVIGIDGILGLEYNFSEIPFNLSVDWKPAFNLYGYNGFWGDGGALSFRYIF